MVLLKRKVMKKLIITSILALLLAGTGTLRADDWPDEYLGLPGDNLNLYAVMDLFQNSETLEGFERSLNDENSRINNLDLNGDNLVDYIMVSDFVDGDVHNIVLRVALNENEYQDVAVFVVEKFANGSVQIQLIGDEALYGKNYIIEPNYAETPNPGYTGRVRTTSHVTMVTTTYWDIARWPVVVYIYRPGYLAWRSAWYWGYWPSYWYAWRPYYWHYYYGYHYHWYPHYYAYYRHWYRPRCHCYHSFYFNRVRVFSPVVAVNIHRGHYKSTYSRPDLKKDGETHGARAYSERGSRMQGNTNVSRDDRRSVNQTTGNQGRVSNSSNTGDRKTTGTANTGSRTYSTTGRSSGTTGRSTSTGTYKSSGSSSAGRTIESTRRTTSTVTNRSTGSSSTGRSTDISRKPTTTVNSKSTGSSSTGRTYNTTSRPTTSGTYKSSSSSSAGRSSGSVNRSSSSGSRSSGSVHRSSSSSSHKSVGRSSSGSRSSGSVHRSSSSSKGSYSKGSSRSSGSGKTSTSRARR
jgi:hypothetical protein